MATPAVLLAMNDAAQQKALHPFFAKTNGIYHTLYPSLLPSSSSPHTLTTNFKEDDSEQQEQPQQQSDALPPSSSLHHVAPQVLGHHDPNQRNPVSLPQDTPVKATTTTTLPADPDHQATDAAQEKVVKSRKRRKLSHDVHPEADVSAPSQLNIDTAMSGTGTGAGSEDLILHQSSPPHPPSSQPDHTLPLVQHQDATEPLHPQHPTSKPASSTTPPKKMMTLKAGGRLASPTSTHDPPNHDTKPHQPRKRGRPKKQKPLLVVVCRYPTKHTIGPTIDRILAGQERYSLPVPTSHYTNPLPKPPIPPAVQKPTHPFFVAKPKEPTPPPPSTAHTVTATATSTHSLHSPRKTSAVTPGKLRAQRHLQKAPDQPSATDLVPYAINRDRMIVKQPGMTIAPWPSKHLAHVRGHFDCQVSSRDFYSSKAATNLAGTSRKMKQTVPTVHPSDYLLNHYQRNLHFDQRDPTRPDGFRDPPISLRVPKRMLLPGSLIQHHVSTRLAPSLHPACASLYGKIPVTLTPYDHGTSEPQAWSQKYAPTSSDHVLQPGREASILKDWMKALTVMAVEGSAPRVAKPDKPDRKPPKKKRRKKPSVLDNFIVGSDDEEPIEMNQLSGPDDDDDDDDENRPHRAQPQKRSEIQTRGGNAKLSSAVLLSGPPGAGKTAMVHAVAKELGFEIFEINPGSRRSGKDVLDRIGDMMENHLVQRHSADPGNTSADEDAGRLSEAFSKDLASGRQGTMASFFKPKSTATQPLNLKNPTATKPKKELRDTTIKTKTKTTRNQKQSLILLEEVDTLFDDDKAFWPTIFTLITNSKRPVVMTCNDEDLVPVTTMFNAGYLHAILRLAPPPMPVAADYLLLMAATEGHLLTRDAVTSLYQSKHRDLRASIAELQFWCQMGVGDPRNGLSWILQRWPPGTGLDEHGHPLRVTSEGTFLADMGVGRDDPLASNDDNSSEEHVLRDWQEKKADPREHLFDQFGVSMKSMNTCAKTASNVHILKNYDLVSSVISDMDVFSSIGTPGETIIDTTEPELSGKARSNYICGMPVLQTPEVDDHDTMSARLTISSTSLVAQAYNIPLGRLATPGPKSINADSTASGVTHKDFANALLPLAYSPENMNLGADGSFPLTAQLDGPFTPIATDIAPYVRSIAAYELALASQRASMSGHGEGKRMRTTRAARSALEGGQRQLTRREKWFDHVELNLAAVLKTGGAHWPRLTLQERDEKAMLPLETDSI